MREKRLKSLTTDELRDIRRDASQIALLNSKRAASARALIAQVNKELHSRGKDALKPVRGQAFSDHSILRFLERSQGMDLEAVRQMMAEAFQDGSPMPYAKGAAVESGGVVFVISQEGVCTTVLTTEMVKQGIEDDDS